MSAGERANEWAMLQLVLQGNMATLDALIILARELQDIDKRHAAIDAIERLHKNNQELLRRMAEITGD